MVWCMETKKIKNNIIEPMKVSAFNKLSESHKLFVVSYVENCFNGTQAYIRAYPKVKEVTARVNASRLLTNANVKIAVEELLKQTYAGIQSDTEKSKTYKLIHALGNVNIRDVVDWENKTLYVKDLKDIPDEVLFAIQSVEAVEKETKFGTDKQIKVTFVSKIKALELRSRIQKLVDPKDDVQQVEITIIPAKKPS